MRIFGSDGTECDRELELLLERAAAGDQEAWGDLLTRHYHRLRYMVALRMDARLRKRLDPSDILQEAFLAASLRLGEYTRNRAVPFYVWLRQITAQQLAVLHRRHLGSKLRDVRREKFACAGRTSAGSSGCSAMAGVLAAHDPRPSEAAMQAERTWRVTQALERLGTLDRELLILRHFEQLTTPEMAGLIGISEAAASKRYLRALSKLKNVLRELSTDEEGP